MARNVQNTWMGKYQSNWRQNCTWIMKFMDSFVARNFTPKLLVCFGTFRGSRAPSPAIPDFTLVADICYSPGPNSSVKQDAHHPRRPKGRSWGGGKLGRAETTVEGEGARRKGEGEKEPLRTSLRTYPPSKILFMPGGLMGFFFLNPGILSS